MATISAEAHLASDGESPASVTTRETAKSSIVYSLGFWSALLASALNLAYMGVMAVVALSGFVLPPPEPAQSIAGIITLLSAPTMVVLVATIHYQASAEQKILSHLGLLFMLGLAVLTCINRFVQLTVVRQGIAAGKEGEVARFLPYSADSIMLAIETLAWGLLLGLAALFLAPVFGRGGDKLGVWIRWLLVATGVLSLVYFVAFATGPAALGYAGVIGWSVFLPVATFLMVPFFWRARRVARVS